MIVDANLVAALAGALVLGLMAVGQAWWISRLRRKLGRYLNQPHPIKISEPTAAQLEAQLRTAYEAQIDASTQVFAKDLEATSGRLGEQVSRLTTTVIEEELRAYQQTLEQVRNSAAEAMEKIHQAVEHQRLELRQGMESGLAAERQKAVERFEAKMGDVVSSYIAESLGGGVDLGSQMPYILSTLEAHKDDIRKDLLGDV